MKTFVYLILSGGLMLMTACGSANAMPVDSKSIEAPLLSTSEPAMPIPATPVPINPTHGPTSPLVADTPSPAMQKMVDLSRENLSQMLKIDIGQIVTVEVEPVIWPDASLGCPKTYLDYIQVMTPGFLVLLEVDGQQYIYHTDEAETVVLCIESDLPMFPVTPGEIQDGIPWVPVN